MSYNHPHHMSDPVYLGLKNQIHKLQASRSLPQDLKDKFTGVFQHAMSELEHGNMPKNRYNALQQSIIENSRRDSLNKAAISGKSHYPLK